MLKISLVFFAIGFTCFVSADIEVINLHPWEELSRIGLGFLKPDVMFLGDIYQSFINTLLFAICGITIAITIGGIFSLFFDWRIVRYVSSFIRSIHEIFWAFLLMPLLGLTPVCGVLAIAIPYSGVFTKVIAEIRQESDKRPLKGLPIDSGRIASFCYASLPVIYQDLKQYSSYRFECALRSSAVLGFIGLPTLGFHLETAFREGNYSQAAAILIVFYLLIASLRFWLHGKSLVLLIVASFSLLSIEFHGSLVNFNNFLRNEILPWPMRREGFYDGTGEIQLPLNELLEWTSDLLQNQVWTGLMNSLILTQVVLVTTALFTLLIFPLITRSLFNSINRGCASAVIIILRTTPEYILAFVLVQLWGPSMLPAMVALTLHNGAIMSHLTGKNAGLINLRLDGAKKRINLYLFEILPRVYGQFLAFLFYRWEVIMRETAILGILGIYTLGFYVDSAMSESKLDEVLFLIFITAILNIAIDSISQIIRKKFPVSMSLVTQDT
ncbi:MAG: ABC transporter permease [Deltaproteobacteria bacterium]|nr:ABC transporter permease [Deltaproteobacteria bacterium]